MRPRATFKQISRSLMDSWISSPDGLGNPEDIYGPFCKLARPNMVLLVVDVRATNPLDFGIDVIQGYRLPTGLADIGTLQRSRSFADVPDTKYLNETVIPAYVGAVQRQRPTMGRVATRVLDTVIGYDQIILPQKNSSGRSEWCIGLLDIHFLLPAASKDGSLDDVDLTILQLLAEGSSTKEIASASNLSHRTIEHRIDILKSRFQARNIAHLAVLSVSAGLGGIVAKDP
ncbi:LuxR C-terminal-related transcriptional regulator [Rhizobium sp. CB3171]|uniref:LuxR C-terminal-related transcriptional regulator n=1 Tax=Rhizobium sp. CB3171 TaxID=3039157 RepID=UPI0024B18F87|nr:LuxR C-terminal-related transcriptional regulator [Rhizobium sp. CB3171]WFU00676.1 LuxR C-terminal-related transcriptional regulator [Rhizobium sp. CB3171]